MKRVNIVKLAVLVLLVAVAAVFSFQPLTDPQKGIPLGLDLRGGVHMVLQAEPGKDGKEISKDDMDTAKAIISKRVNELGISEPVVQTDYDKKRVIVDIAGIQDPDKAVDIIKTTAKLTFRDPQGNVVLEGDQLKDARADTGQGGRFVVNISFSPEGARKFADLTSKYVGQRIGIYLDEEILTNPTVQTIISDGHAEITGYSTLEEAANDAVLMRSGSLPVSMSIAEKRHVGASLGVDSLQKSIRAGIFGIAFIFLFMVAFYRLPGFIADFSLIAYILIVLWILKLFGAVLTLPGIAGLILSIGMAVDSNIIIYERIKEELRLGKSLRAAVESGFSRAFATVIDAQVTTLIAAVTLYFLTAASVKGFALTLGIGILVSLFTAITFTRFVLRLLVGISPKMNTFWYGVRREV
ncbi:MAG: protein translocase subunit SecD [Desulfitobacteriaceae bacterium]|nr:protein translocase subunit SecD [Desulfitobacteriaceae bacterium]MDD4346995.1 protein translocase subunit SecD [Desulfitobacteriaceae bacterium]MDD4402087.1 protein translocase subunit SecD [Desulfitobacteriaceae bacterium]